MSLVTRCTVCGTAFRVQRAQLAVRGGRVRCGKCGTVFDGVAGLVEEGGERLSLEPSPQLGLFDPSRRPAPPAPARPQDAPLPAFMAEEAAPRRSIWLWSLAALLAISLLAAQAAYRYRAELAALVPQARVPLEAACEHLGCDVPLPRWPELMAIEGSDLQAEPRREGVIVLNALLRNRARFAQAYPALELTLTDEADRPVLRRVFGPGDYLEGERARELMARGIPAGGEASLRMYLDPNHTGATGYRLYLFYPT